MKVTIEKVTEKGAPLYCKYPGQGRPQKAYVQLDCRNGELTALANPEIGNAIPFIVHYGHLQRWPVTSFASGVSINEFLEELLPACQVIVDGYESYFDGNNGIAQFSERAQDTIEQIEHITHHWESPETLFMLEPGECFDYDIWSALLALQDTNQATFNQYVIEGVEANGWIYDEGADDPLSWVIEQVVNILSGNTAFGPEQKKEIVKSLPNWFTKLEEVKEAIVSYQSEMV